MPRLSDLQQIAEGFQCPVCLMGKHALGQYFAQLYAFLVEAVQVPQESLEHHLVLKVRKQRTQCFRRQLFTDDDAGRPVSGKMLVPVLILFAAGKGDHLRRHVRAEFLLAGAVLDYDIRLRLVVHKADELQGNDICSLVKQLIEGMLSICTRFTEDDRPGRIIKRPA